MSRSEKLRILQIVPSFGVGGAEQMAGHLMAGLAESVDVAAATLGPATGSPIEKRLLQAGIPLWHMGKRKGFEPGIFFSLDRILRQVRPHVVHTHLSVLRYALPGLCWRRIPVVVHTMHNMAEHEADGIGRMVQWLAFRGLVLPVAISREVAASFQRVYRLECKTVVPNCIPVDDYRRLPAARALWRKREGLEPDAIVFACVGRLEPQKNPLLLLQSFAALNDPRTRLILCGDGSLSEPLAAYTKANGLEGRVRFLGKRNDIPECLAASDVFVLSSNWEGNPLAVMEAMAAGLPVISTAVGGVPELVQSGTHGLLAPAGDCAAFTNAMRVLADDPSTRAAMASAARARATADFALERMAHGYMSLYRSALAASSAAVSAASAAAV
jgi:glycosyltransferase involved in cell wall biosynthesis